MSPEQIQGALDLDARSDLYSLGVTLYEMVTARRPFQGDSDYSIMAAHLSSNPVPPIQIDPSVPQLLNEVILMAIQKDPGQRFQTADAFRSALQSVGASLKPASAPRAVPVGAGAAAAVGAPQKPPQYVPPQVQVAVPPSTPQKSRRGLWIGLGSLVTIAVLVLIALQAPRFFGPTSAATDAAATTAQTPQTATVPEPQPPSAQQPSTEVAVPAAQPPASQAPAVTASSVPPSQPPMTAAAQAPRTRGGSTSAAQGSFVPPPQQPVQQQQQAMQVPAQQPPAQPAAAQQTSGPSQADVEALRANRELLMMLGTRANSVKASLGTMKQQQARMGVNMNQNILTAEQRMEFFLDDAQAALKAGDAARAKKNLESAERALETIEKFLGR
jgi:serine/threonine-protein kinase